MKVIGKSNFDNEIVVAEDMNDKSSDNSTYYYKAVEDDYVLYVFEP